MIAIRQPKFFFVSRVHIFFETVKTALVYQKGPCPSTKWFKGVASGLCPSLTIHRYWIGWTVEAPTTAPSLRTNTILDENLYGSFSRPFSWMQNLTKLITKKPGFALSRPVVVSLQPIGLFFCRCRLVSGEALPAEHNPKRI